MTTAVEKANPVSVFKHEMFGEVRIIDRAGEPWFVGKDVCNACGISDARQAVESLDSDERYIIPVTDSLGREQDTYIISEAGLYSLILRSRKPEAKVFKRWVTHEVLPSIRKHGAYMTSAVTLEVMQRPENLIALVQKLHDEMTKRISAEEKIATNAPKVDTCDRFLTEGEEISMGDLAKKLQHEGIAIGQNQLFKLLRDKGVLIRRPGINFNMPKQHYAERGWFKIIAPPPVMSARWRKQLRITPKGVVEISKRMHELFGADLD